MRESTHIDGDSILSFTANIIGILTFIIAAAAAFYARYVIYTNTALHAEFREIIEEIASFADYLTRILHERPSLASPEISADLVGMMKTCLENMTPDKGDDSFTYIVFLRRTSRRIYNALTRINPVEAQRIALSNVRMKELISSITDNGTRGGMEGDVLQSDRKRLNGILRFWKPVANMIDPKWRHKRNVMKLIQKEYSLAKQKLEFEVYDYQLKELRKTSDLLEKLEVYLAKTGQHAEISPAGT